MFALGPIFLGFSLWSWIHTERFLHHAYRVTGQIVRLNQDDNDGHRLYAPVFRFTAEDGRMYTVESNNYSSPPEFVAGQTVPILYIPSEPASARIETSWQLRGMETVSLLLGWSFPLLALASIWWRRPRIRFRRV